MMSFAENLQYIRNKNNVTQEQLAEQLEVSRQSVSKWESGISFPEMNTLLRICELYQVKMDDLMRGSVEISSAEEEKKYDRHMNTFSIKIAASIGLLIAGAGMTALMDELKVSDNILTPIFLCIVVIAVFTMITAGMEHARFVQKHPVIKPFYPEEVIDAFERKFIYLIAGPIAAIILMVAGIAVFDGSRYEDFAGCALLFVVAIAVTIMIYAGMQKDKYNIKEYNKEYIKENNPTPSEKRSGIYCGVIMLIASLCFFVWGIVGTHMGYSQSWGISWISFPVGGVLCGIVSMLMSEDAKRSDTSGDTGNAEDYRNEDRNQRKY